MHGPLNPKKGEIISYLFFKLAVFDRRPKRKIS